MSIISAQSILDALHKIPQQRWGAVLESIHHLEPKAVALPEGKERGAGQ